MPSIKEYDVKLHSLKNTEKMTRTMKLVAMSKLYKAQEAQRNAKLYAQKLTDLIHRLSASVESASHPLLTPAQEVDQVHILVFTSDKGLCGAYNNALIKGVERWMRLNAHRYQKVYLSFCGKRGYMSFRRHENVLKHYEGVTARPDFREATDIAKELSDGFLSGNHQEVYVSYNNYHSPLKQTPMFDKILPIEPRLLEGGTKISTDYIFEPPKKELLEALIPRYLYFRLFFALLENSAGEHGARMTAMDNATKNANAMIDKFTMLRNRARQAAITTELIEIVSGAEVLR